MKKALFLSLALIALTACNKNEYDTLQECFLKEEQKGGRPSTVTDYCMSLDLPIKVPGIAEPIG